MGQMRFTIPRPEQVPPQFAQLAYLGGSDEVPWQCESKLAGDLLTITRDDHEACCLYCTWIDEARGPILLCTGNLGERTKPYQLPLELARGTLNRLRNQTGAWQMAGLKLPADFPEQMKRALEPFVQAILSQDDPPASADWAAESIHASLELTERVAREYAQQVTAIRHEQNTPASTLFGLRQSSQPSAAQASRITDAFNTSWLAVDWSRLQPTMETRNWAELDRLLDWARERSQKVCLGPILQFDRKCLPDWLFLWEDEFESVVNYAVEHVSQTIRRYKGKVNLWHISSGSNLPQAIALAEDQRLKLTVEVVERARQLDPRTPIIVGFDLPFSEYIAVTDQELTPLHHADMLVRGNLGVAGIALELNLGFAPGASCPRDPLAISRLVDRWSQLGVPLVVQLSLPLEDSADPASTSGAEPALRELRRWAPNYVEILLRLLIAKQAVQAVVWNQATDQSDRLFPHAGVFAGSGTPKPALALLESLRRELLPH